MTDNEIIKGLKCCKSHIFCCDLCPYLDNGCTNSLCKDALRLFKKQKADIRAKAIKEFAERLEGKAEFTTIAGYIKYSRLIDNLVKEMVEEKNEH